MPPAHGGRMLTSHTTWVCAGGKGACSRHMQHGCVLRAHDASMRSPCMYLPMEHTHACLDAITLPCRHAHPSRTAISTACRHARLNRMPPCAPQPHAAMRASTACRNARLNRMPQCTSQPHAMRLNRTLSF
eukprot:364126-Chlamydomonas_euryale.AAC.12